GLNKGNIDLLQVVDLLKERATFVSDFMEGNYFFTIPKNPDLITLKKKQKPDSKETIEALVKRLSVLNNFTAETIEADFKLFLTEKSKGFGEVLPIFRILLTGVAMGPSLFRIAAVLGKTETLNRLTNGLKYFNNAQN